MSTLQKSLVSIAIGLAISLTPLRDSSLVKILINITGG